jgi:hypothetical protein
MPSYCTLTAVTRCSRTGSSNALLMNHLSVMKSVMHGNRRTLEIGLDRTLFSRIEPRRHRLNALHVVTKRLVVSVAKDELVYTTSLMRVATDLYATPHTVLYKFDGESTRRYAKALWRAHPGSRPRYRHVDVWKYGCKPVDWCIELQNLLDDFSAGWTTRISYCGMLVPIL